MFLLSGLFPKFLHSPLPQNTHTHMHTPSLSFENQCTQPSLWTPSLVPPNWITVPPPVWCSGKCTQCLSQSWCPINVSFILSFPLYIIKTVWITPYCILLFTCPLHQSILNSCILSFKRYLLHVYCMCKSLFMLGAGDTIISENHTYTVFFIFAFIALCIVPGK